MCERRKVAGGAQGALLRDNGGNALVEHLEQHLNEQGADAAHAAAERVGAQQHHAADDLVGIRLAGAGAVAEDQVGGELVAHLLGDGDLLELAEAGGDAVGNAPLGGDLLGERAGLLHGLERGGSQLDRRVVARDGDEGLERQAVAVNDDVLDRSGIHDHGDVLFSQFFSLVSAVTTPGRAARARNFRNAPLIFAPHLPECGERSARSGMPQDRSESSIS